MKDFVVHGIPGSPFLRSVLVALEEKRAPYRVQALEPSSTRSEQYRRLHPFGRVPVIEHGAFVLYETQAILRYIDAVYPDPALQPHAPEALGRMNQIIGINDWYLFPQVARIIVFNRIIGPALLGMRPDETAIAAAVPDARLCLGELDRLVDGQPFLAGEHLTIADLMLAPQVYYLAATPEGAAILKATSLLSWLGRMNARPSMMATVPPEAFRKAA